MQVRFHKSFRKRYKSAKKMQKHVDERIALFIDDPFNPILNNHPLHGEYRNCRSINITGDWRAIYKLLAPDLAVFIILGSHSELYE